MRKIKTVLSLYSFFDYPEKGWEIDGRIMPPPNAYCDNRSFINSALDAFFPEKKERFLNIFNGDALRIHHLEEKAVCLLCKLLNEKVQDHIIKNGN